MSAPGIAGRARSREPPTQAGYRWSRPLTRPLTLVDLRSEQAHTQPTEKSYILSFVLGTDFDERAFFQGIAQSGARALLIGRRALVALGLPLLTADYDFWVHPDDVARFNAAVEPVGLVAIHTPEEVRKRGRYVLENDEHVDVLAMRTVSTVDGVAVAFDDLWTRRQTLHLDPDTPITIPSLADLILTKRFAARPKDIEDFRLLQTLLAAEGKP